MRHNMYVCRDRMMIKGHQALPFHTSLSLVYLMLLQRGPQSMPCHCQGKKHKTKKILRILVRKIDFFEIRDQQSSKFSSFRLQPNPKWPEHKKWQYNKSRGQFKVCILPVYSPFILIFNIQNFWII